MTIAWWFKVTFLGWLSDHLERLSDLQLGNQKVTLNHLEDMLYVWSHFTPVYELCVVFSPKDSQTLHRPKIHRIFWKYLYQARPLTKFQNNLGFLALCRVCALCSSGFLGFFGLVQKTCRLTSWIREGVNSAQIIIKTSLKCGCFLKWWYPQNTPKWSLLVGKPIVVGYHHLL